MRTSGERVKTQTGKVHESGDQTSIGVYFEVSRGAAKRSPS